MGDIADYYTEKQMFETPPENAHEIKQYDVWKMGQGYSIKLIDMDENHIDNCISMIKNRKNFRKDWSTPLEKELLRRKNILCYSIW